MQWTCAGILFYLKLLVNYNIYFNKLTMLFNFWINEINCFYTSYNISFLNILSAASPNHPLIVLIWLTSLCGLMSSDRRYARQRNHKKIFNFLFLIILLFLCPQSNMSVFCFKKNQRYNISEDTWRQVLSFSRCVHENLGGYDPEGTCVVYKLHFG